MSFICQSTMRKTRAHKYYLPQIIIFTDLAFPMFKKLPVKLRYFNFFPTKKDKIICMNTVVPQHKFVNQIRHAIFYKPVSQSCTVAKSEKFWQVTAQST